MKTLIIYKSVHHMNTQKVAEAMADAIGADPRKVEEVEPAMLAEYDLIGFGSGIYHGKHHKTLLDFVAGLPQQGKSAFVFSTSGGAKKTMHRELRAALVQKGFAIKGEFACPGFDTYGAFKLIGGIRKGCPNEKDLEKAQAFAKGLLLAP
ncbi:MAG TPA: flavodoxin family protein [Methanoregulaceae archaeon]|nr:flavodoxin family protein [Methanoregulaceae archaeon]HPJ75038.1 flavodoxin family protein [Methanoregulaceae archaeon]HPQ75850.1 flavodoxin family protein [Methanoregulaceae archaeon]HRX34041.1 flavodoxin family protein [Methanoregulaceae archaeon]